MSRLCTLFALLSHALADTKHTPSGSECIEHLSNQHLCTFEDVKFHVLSDSLNTPPTCIDICNDVIDDQCLHIDCTHFKINVKNPNWHASFQRLQKRLGIHSKDIRLRGQDVSANHPIDHSMSNCGLSPNTYRQAIRTIQQKAKTIPSQIHSIFNDNIHSFIDGDQNRQHAVERLNEAVNQWRTAVVNGFPESKRSQINCVLDNMAYASSNGEDPGIYSI